VDNAITRFKRPDFIAHRDFTPIETLDDHCLAGFDQAVA
jgi:ectoine hydroxylase